MSSSRLHWDPEKNTALERGEVRCSNRPRVSDMVGALGGGGMLPGSRSLHVVSDIVLHTGRLPTEALSGDEPGEPVPFIFITSAVGPRLSRFPPVRRAMYLSISFLACSTFSGVPRTSKYGSMSRDGVMMYVPVFCWMRLTVAPFGPTTKPTTRYGTRTKMVTFSSDPASVDPTLGGDPELLLREALICEKWSAAWRISFLATLTSSGLPVMMKIGSSPRTGVLM